MRFPRDGRPALGVSRRPSPIFLLVIAIAVAGGVLAWDADLQSTRAKFGVFLLVVFGWIVTLCLHEFAHA